MMQRKIACSIAACLLVSLLIGCDRLSLIPGKSSAAGASFSPAVSHLKWSTVEPGVEVAETHSAGGQEADRVWLYRPSASSKNLPCVIIAPAGTRLFHGILLGDGDRSEHIPYVKAGYAAVIAAANKFKGARGGVKSAQTAISIARSLPWVNPKRLFVAGHSSAATLALEVAAVESKNLAGCLAYAPEVNATQFLAPVIGALESQGASGLRSTLDSVSPHNNATRITCPLFLFAATNDDVINPRAVEGFASTVRSNNKEVTFESVPTGGHFDAMIQSGIPAGIRWMNTKK